MGIKFDILYDRILLAEASEFSKFFTSTEPIQKIHKELKVSHDTHLVLSPTNNRHELWNTLRSGKAIFASINRPKSIEHAKQYLLSQVKSLPRIPNRGRSRNEISSIVQRLISSAAGESISSFGYKQIKRRIMGPMPVGKKSIMDLVNELYPEKTELKTALEDFVSAIKPGNYILVKRVPLGPKTSWAVPSNKPAERRFPVRDERDKNDKVFGQEYVAWTFDGDRLINKERIAINAIKVYNQLFSGWGDRDFYIVDDAKFLQIKKHPFVSSSDFSFVEIIPLEENSVKLFATSSIQKYQKILNDKVKQSAEQMKSRMYASIDQIDVPEAEITKNITEYREALRLLDQGVSRLNPSELFKEFLRKDSRLELNDYIIIHADRPFDLFDPYSMAQQTPQSRQDWEILNKQFGITAIEKFASQGFETKRDQPIKVRSKADRSIEFTSNVRSFAEREDANQYEMFDANHNRWVPFDPKYLDEFKVEGEAVAIAFKNLKDYNDFVRRFVMFAIRTIVKTPEVKNIVNLLSDF